MMMRFLMLLMFVLGTGQKSWSEESTLYNAGIGTWTDSHGKTVALKEFKGHKVVLGLSARFTLYKQKMAPTLME